MSEKKSENRSEIGGLQEREKGIEIALLDEHGIQALAGIEAHAKGFLDHAEAHAEGADVSQEIREMKEVAEQVKALRVSFREKVNAIARRPGEMLREYSDKKWAEELAKPDNPKVIEKIDDLVKKIVVIKEKIQQRKSRFDNDSQIDEHVKKAVAYFERAAKQKEEKWSDTRSAVQGLLSKKLTAEISAGQSKDALWVWSKLDSGEKKHNWQQGYQLVDLVIKENVSVDKNAEQFQADLFFSKRTSFEKSSSTISAILAGTPDLFNVYQQEVPVIKTKLFNKTELFLLQQSPKAVDNLKELNESEQHFIIKAWQKDEVVEKVMENQNAPALIAVMRDFPAITLHNVADIQIVEAIANRFGERKTLLDKLQPLQKGAGLSWEAAQGALIISSFTESTKEHFQKLTTKKMQALTAVMIVSGEEGIHKLWSEENVAVYAAEGERSWGKESHDLIPFAKDISPIVKKHLPTEFGWDDGSHEGLKGQVHLLENFKNVVDVVPPALREQLFAVLKVSQREPIVSYDMVAISETEASNFIQFQQLCGGDPTIGFDGLVGLREFFSDERWPAVKKGFEIFNEAGLTSTIGNNFRVYELAGGPEGEAGNALVQKFMAGPDIYAYPDYRRFTRGERSGRSIERLYEFSIFCKRELTVDTDLALRFLKIDEMGKKAVQAFLSGELVDAKKDYVDMPVVEGEMLALARKFSTELGKGSDSLMSIDFLRFQKLDSQQKKDYFSLYDRVYEEYGMSKLLFSAVEGGAAKKVIDFIATSKLEGRLNAAYLLKMAERPDCAQLFNHIKNESSESVLAAIDKLIALHDAGLPDSFSFLLETSTHRSDSSFSSDILKWDVAKLAEIVRQATELKLSPISLRSIVMLAKPEESAQETVLRIRAAALHGHTFISVWEALPDEAELRGKEKRLQDVKVLIGGSVEDTRGIISNLSPEVWDRLKTNPVWLKNCLAGVRQNVDEVAQLSPEILNEPLFWEVRWPESTLKNEAALQSAFEIMKKLRLAGFDATSQVNESAAWEGVLRASKNSPWLFESANIALLKALEVNLDQLGALSDVTLEDFATLRSYSEILSFEPYDVYHFFSKLHDGKLISLEELQQVRQLSHGKIGFRMVNTLLGQRQPSETLEQTVKRFDLPQDGDSSSRNSFSEQEYREWRIRDILTKAAESAPQFVDWVQKKGFSLDFYQSISDLPKGVLINLERMIPSKDGYSWYQLKESGIEVLKVMAAHPNADAVVSMAAAYPLIYQSLFDSSSPRLISFLEKLTPEVVKKFSEIPSFVSLSGVDAADFFEDPILADKIIDLAKRLRVIFGEEFEDRKLSVYDLLIMDFDTDLRNLQELQETCFNTLNVDTIKALIVISEGSRLVTLQKVLLLFEKEGKIDFSLAVTQLEKIPAALRADVILSKGAQNFGWDIVRYRKQLVQMAGMSQEDYSSLIFDLYNSARDSMKEIDYETAVILLQGNARSSDSKSQRTLAVIKTFAGLPEQLIEVLFKDPQTIVELAATEWDAIPGDVKKSALFWNKLFDAKPALFLVHYAEKPAGFVLNIEQQRTIINKMLEGGDVNSLGILLRLSIEKEISLNDEETAIMVDRQLLGLNDLTFLQFGVEQDKSKSEFVTLCKNRVAYFAEHWRDDVGRTAELFERLTKFGALETKYFSTIQAMMAEASVDQTIAERVNKIFVELVLRLDPSLQHTFKDPQKLGKLRSIVVQNLALYAKELVQKDDQSGTREQKIEKDIRKKLMEIKRVFESSETSESAKRLIFLEMYNLQDCQDPSIKSKEDMKGLVERDVREILILSGSENERRFLKRLLLTDPSRAEQEKAGEYLQLANEAIWSADQRNRSLAEPLPIGALTHGTSSVNLGLVLDGGNFSGELLGPNSKRDQSGLLGVDVSKVLEAPENKDLNTLQRRLQWLSNGSYGDVLLVYGEYDDKDTNRMSWQVGVTGNDHKLVRTGIPSTEITSLVIRNSLNGDAVLEQTKKSVAEKGFYIPIYDVSESLLFSPEEFDTMKIFYQGLHERGYPSKIIDDVYAFYKNPTGSEKHTIVIRKAFEQSRAQLNAGKSVEDLVVLVSFLRGNDLNTRDVSWYKKASFDEIMDIIGRGVGKKVRQKARDLLTQGTTGEKLPLGQAVREAQTARSLGRKNNIFIDNFFEKQLVFAGQENEAGKYKKAMVDLLFGRAKDGARFEEIARTFSEQKKVLMRKLWEQSWSQILSDTTIPDQVKSEWQSYQAMITPVLTGSAGRGEIVLGSDLDYLLMVDDEAQAGIDEEKLSNFINTVLAEKMNGLLEANGIKADAGLAKKDRKPYTKLSTLKQFEINLQNARQDEEPTTIVDIDPLFDSEKDLALVRKSKEYLVVENPTASLLTSYIQKDLELGGEKYPSYTKRFEELYESFASGNVLNKIKESLQRVITFKTYQLLFSAFNSERISKAEAKDIPASTSGKLDFLESHGILTNEESQCSKELLGITYKLRFLGEVFSEEAQKDESSKVYNVKFRVEDLSYTERFNLFGLLQKYKTNVLYK